MKKLHTFGLGETPLAEMLKERLAQEGIACVLRNTALGTALGEIPLTECFPELWLLDAETWPKAKNLLRQWLAETAGDTWTCPACGAVVDPPLEACWRCERERS